MNTPQQLAARITACFATVELTEENIQMVMDVLFDCREFLLELGEREKAKEEGKG